jgi:hypothetical protein
MEASMAGKTSCTNYKTIMLLKENLLLFIFTVALDCKSTIPSAAVLYFIEIQEKSHAKK